MQTLGREAILQAKDITTVSVEVPEWGGAVHLRPMTGAERDVFDAKVVEKKGDLRGFRVALVAQSVCDENGQLLFSEADAEALAAKSGVVLGRLAEKASELNGLQPEVLEKN